MKHTVTLAQAEDRLQALCGQSVLLDGDAAPPVDAFIEQDSHLGALKNPRHHVETRRHTSAHVGTRRHTSSHVVQTAIFQTALNMNNHGSTHLTAEPTAQDMKNLVPERGEQATHQSPFALFRDELSMRFPFPQKTRPQTPNSEL